MAVKCAVTSGKRHRKGGKIVVSYSIFGSRKECYWQFVPFNVIVNELLYPGAYTRIYLHEDTKAVPVFRFLKECVRKKAPKLEVVTTDIPYVKGGRELRQWRMRPIWDHSVDYCFVREGDSVSNIPEARASRYFMKTGWSVQMIRGHMYHEGVMAGLTGFFCPKVRRLVPATFEKYDAFSKQLRDPEKMEHDQHAMRMLFEHQLEDIVDFPMETAKPHLKKKIHIVPESEYAYLSMDDVPEVVRSICTKVHICPGASKGVLNSDLAKVTSLDTETARIVKKVLRSDSLFSYWTK